MMVLQYRKKKDDSRWRDYPGEKNITGDPQEYKFRLLSHDKSKILENEGTYEKVLKRMRQIEFFKRKKGKSRTLGIINAFIE